MYTTEFENLQEANTAPRDSEAFASMTSLEITDSLRAMGWFGPEALKIPSARQSAEEITRVIIQAEAGIAAISAAECEAGPAAARRIADARGFQATRALVLDRKTVAMQLMGQRNGLLRALLVQERTDFILTVTPNVLKFLDILLDLSANVSVVSGSGWMATQTWLHRNCPMVLEELGPARVKIDFDRKTAVAAKTLSSRVIVNRSALRTAPSAVEIAERLGLTREHLRIARAKSGMTSIDRQDRKELERERIAGKRRAAGVKLQSERTTRKDDVALASLAGCTDRTIRKHRLEGTLDAFLNRRGVNFPEELHLKNKLGATEVGSSEPISQVTNTTHESGILIDDATRPVSVHRSRSQRSESVPLHPEGFHAEAHPADRGAYDCS